MSNILDSLGWALLHSVWQGAVAFGLVCVIRLIGKPYSPSMRYISYMMILLGTLIAFLITFSLKLKASNFGLQNTRFLPDQTSILSQSAISDALSATADQILLTGATLDIPASLAFYVPIIAIIWCFGFAVQSSRYAVSFALTQRLRREGLSAPTSFWTLRFETLAANAGLNDSVKLYVSQYIQSPMTMGFFKPIVLVPVGFLTKLPQEQVEAILLHEMAHIRRYDYALNLIQITIKSVFFFHPAIHAISRLIDIEREEACDDLAVAQGRNPQALALGLASLKLGVSEQSFVMAAHKKSTPLLNRLNRLTGPHEKTQKPEQVILSLLTAFIMGSIYFGTAHAGSGIKLNQKTTTHNEADFKSVDIIQIDEKKIRKTFYKQLIKDGLIKSTNESAVLKPYGKSWSVNGNPVPTTSEDSYCALMSQLNIEKSKLSKLKLSPKSIYVVTQNNNPTRRQTREITYGEFTPPQVRDASVYLMRADTPKNETSPSFILPVGKADVTAHFGIKGELWPTKHLGIDFRGNMGDPVIASADGKVLSVTDESGYGKRVTVKHAGGIITTYSHMNSISVEPNNRVKAGDIIGTIGSTGKSTGPHLHFEMIKEGQKIDPKPYIF